MKTFCLVGATALYLLLIMEEGNANVQVKPVNTSNIFLPIGSVVPKLIWQLIDLF